MQLMALPVEVPRRTSLFGPGENSTRLERQDGPTGQSASPRSSRRWGRRRSYGDITVHGLRHTHHTLAFGAGIRPKVVSERLGHSTVSLTIDVYSHAVPALEEEAASRIAALVKS